MESEPQRPPQKTSAPRRNVRLAWWFSIYISGSAPLMAKTLLGNVHTPPEVFIFWPLILPSALFGLVGYAMYALHLGMTLMAESRRQFDVLLILLVILVLLNQAILSDLANHMRG